MNYRIQKPAPDLRTNTCGIFLPDGYYTVMGMSFDNARQFENIKKFGYTLDKTDEPDGIYEAATGKRLEMESVERLTYYGTGSIRYQEAPKSTPAIKAEPKPEPSDPETEQLRKLCDVKGIKYKYNEKAPSLRKKINAAKKSAG